MMQIKACKSTIALLGIVSLSMGLPACSTSSQRVSSRNLDVSPAAESGNSKSQPMMETAPSLNLDLSVDAAYAAIPHRRTAMDFASSNMPERDRVFLEVAFHLIDEAIRRRVSAYQKFSNGETNDSQTTSDLQRLIEYLENAAAPAGLTGYQAQLVQALSDQRVFFEEWRTQGPQFQYAQTIGSHPRVQSASTALRAAYGILMATYSGESNNNKQAFFDYHCALDFI
jgi:hypothetical protein